MVERLVLPNDDGSDDSLVIDERMRVDGVEGVSLCWERVSTFLSNKEVEQLQLWLNKRSQEQQHAKTLEWVKNNLSSKTQHPDEEMELRAEQSGLSSYDEDYVKGFVADFGE